MSIKLLSICISDKIHSNNSTGHINANDDENFELIGSFYLKHSHGIDQYNSSLYIAYMHTRALFGKLIFLR